MEGRTPVSRQHFAAALEIARKSNVPEQMPNPTWGLGLCLWNLGRWRESREQLELLLQGARKHGNRTALCGALDNLGPLLAALGDTVRARQVLEESGPLARSRGDRSSSGFVLHRLGRVGEQEGRFDDAQRLYTESLALRREIHHLSGAVDSLIALGCLALAREEGAKAREHLEQGRDLAKEVGLSGMAAFATVFLALAPGGDAAAAGEALAAHESRLDVRARMEARYAMWKVSGDRAHIAEAHRLVCFVRDHAPEECRVAMIEKVPLHREIMAAFGAG